MRLLAYAPEPGHAQALIMVRYDRTSEKMERVSTVHEGSEEENL